VQVHREVVRRAAAGTWSCCACCSAAPGEPASSLVVACCCHAGPGAAVDAGGPLRVSPAGSGWHASLPLVPLRLLRQSFAGLLLASPAACWSHAAAQLALGRLSMLLWPCCERCRAVRCAPGRLGEPCCRCQAGRGVAHTVAGLLHVSPAGWCAAYTSRASPATLLCPQTGTDMFSRHAARHCHGPWPKSALRLLGLACMHPRFPSGHPWAG